MIDLVEIINIAALINILLLFLANAVGLELIMWTYVTNRHTRAGQLFLGGVIFLLLWLDLDFVASQPVGVFPEEIANGAVLWAARGLYALLALFFAGFYRFALNFPVRNPLDKKQRCKNNIGIFLWTLLFASSFLPLIVGEINFNPEIPILTITTPGFLFWPYALAAAGFFIVSFFELSRNRRFADVKNRLKARFAAVVAGIFGGFNLVFNVFGPGLGESWEYMNFFALFANYAVLVSLGFIFYKASFDKLYGIKIILVEIFVGLMGASLVMMPFFVDLLWQQALLIVLFMLFCVFGYILIRSTIKEYREKELLEQKIARRTRELERAKMNLEEMNSVLGVRVSARTRELEQLNRTLEQKIAARTKDLEIKVKALERFQKITIGRELKMIELKKEIEKLRAGKLDAKSIK